MPADLPRQILDAYPPHLKPNGPIHDLGSAGGLSGSRFYRFDAPVGPLALHGWPPGGPRSEATIRQIHTWMNRLDALGFVPAVYADRIGQTVQTHAGVFWELLSWRPGQSVEQPRPSQVSLALEAIGRVHRALADERKTGASPGLIRRLDELTHLERAGGFDRLEQAASSAPAFEGQATALDHLRLARRTAPEIRRRLAQAASLVDLRLQPCLRDLHAAHVLFQENRVTGLVDFGAMAWESPAGDLARLLGDWAVPDTLRPPALEAYAHAAGQVPDPWLIHTFESSGALLAGCRWATWLAIEHRRFPPGVAASRLARCLAALIAATGRHA